MNVVYINKVKMFDKIYDVVADTITIDKWVRLYSVERVADLLPSDAMDTYRMWCDDITEILVKNEETDLSEYKIKYYSLLHRDLKDYKEECDWEMVRSMERATRIKENYALKSIAAQKGTKNDNIKNANPNEDCAIFLYEVSIVADRPLSV